MDQPGASWDSSSLATLLAALASKSPTPGGGGSVAIAGATAAATVEMAVAYSAKRFAAHEGGPDHAGTLATLERLRDGFLASGPRDADAFEALQSAQRRVKETGADGGDDADLRAATEACMAVPMDQLRSAVELLRLADGIAEAINPRLASDLAIGAVLADAAASAAVWNVRVNAGGPDGGAAGASVLEARALGAEASALRSRIEVACGGGPLAD